MFAFVQKIVSHQKKDYCLLLIILTLLASFEFCFLAMYEHLSHLGLDTITFMFISFIPFIALIIAIVLSIFITKYFIQNKQHEFSMLLLFGRKPKDLFTYLMIQYGIMLIIAFLLGFCLGILWMLGMNTFFQFIQLNFLFQYNIPYTLFIYMFFILATFILILAISASQFTYIDCHIMETLTQKTTRGIAPYKISMSRHFYKRQIPIGSILIAIIEFIILFYSIYALITISLLENKLVYFLLCFSAIIYLSNRFIPLLFDLCHQQIVHHPFLFHAMTSYMYMTHQLSSITNIHSIILPLIFMLLIMCDQTNFLSPFIIPCFVMILMMLLLSFIIKYTLYLQSLQRTYATQGALGYHPQQLFKISLLKNLIFLLSIVFIPYLYIHYLGQYIIMSHILKSQVMYSLEILYVVLYLIFMMYMICKEKQFIKEVTSHVKYLNRSE
ncbi:hypothetical protein NMU03_08360 [Allocoprobacillus halotolerans]|uniref:ABC3 transporter permease C-terminal domain-containing protein n=1 Tax=Allocoprobacillus halotolerans TaxID=2944914 RepID=A0ABY5I5Y1_9FIRM|nr:FtsX-like permease family protein [Allocoprobacillus halotolerans]UTY40749.1 hypothetical protein NMU03_08360 [Allocoprobacillus halotolerans]